MTGEKSSAVYRQPHGKFHCPGEDKDTSEFSPPFQMATGRIRGRFRETLGDILGKEEFEANGTGKTES